eukprot:TRINITY_DN8706_c0_g1_i16.p1 TRINITY_DN8706_c0_g1~~TRINITY_DN8706_c0_g1_i16.p1  ORF type:complete len:1587 (+),score=310.50 TRINITY_DN8706_c0_g1_i16:111-4871(+)
MCGNWGILCLAEFAENAAKRGEVFPARLQMILQGMLDIIQLRGAQAGGCQLITSASSGADWLCTKALKPKRGDLGQTLFRKFNRKLLQRHLLRGKLASVLPCCRIPNRGSILMQGHTRFGTSSTPQLIETHPHQWFPEGTSTAVWKWKKGDGWTRKMTNCCVTITHNGDFDAWRPYRETTIHVGKLGLWLNRVLQQRHNGLGDSAKIAGVIELLVCQGSWQRAVRYAYHLHVACHVDQASGWTPLSASAGSTVPGSSAINAWANAFEAEFKKTVDKKGSIDSNLLLDVDSGTFQQFLACCKEQLLEGPCRGPTEKWIPDTMLDRFANAAIAAFRDNDPLVATSVFLCHADGTFGLSVTCTLWPQKVVLAAKGQPMSLAFGGHIHGGHPQVAFWSSEPRALGSAGDSKSPAVARYDLDDQFGEVLEVSIESPHNAAAEGVIEPEFQHVKEKHLESPLEARLPIRKPPAPLSDDDALGEAFAVRIGERTAPDRSDVQEVHYDVTCVDEVRLSTSVMELPQHILMIRGLRYSKEMSGAAWQSEPLSQESFHAGLMEIGGPVAQNQSMLMLERKKVCKDIVAADLDEIPRIIREIDYNWSDEKSLNVRSAQLFAELLLSSKVGARRQQIDVLVFGVESSLWMAQQFCADLTRLFPHLRAVAMSSNVVLGLLQGGPGHVNPSNWTYGQGSFKVGRETLCLAVSHSGTSYATIWAARYLGLRSERVFGMSSSFDCLLARSIGQAPMEPFTNRLFSTLVGIRPAEAATVATVAMQHTLSYLLLSCTAQATGYRIPSLMECSRKELVEGLDSVQSAPQDFGESSMNSSVFHVRVNRHCAATTADVRDMHRLLLTLYYGATASCGVDGHGNKSELDTHNQLKLTGHKWSHHITESYWATFIPAAYVLITVTAGIPPVTTVGQQIADASMGEEVILEAWLLWLLRALDALVYTFLPIIVAVIHRKLTGRRLWMRFTTRTLLVLESTMNYKLLRAYVSKLMALSWRFATLSVVGQNGCDHFVHEYTHKAQSDVLLAVGLTDGRLPSLASSESSVLMSVQQAKFIKGKGRGIEPYVLGHNPWTRQGLFAHVVKLPTSRLRFASEQVMMHDKLKTNEGIAPSEVLQRWTDLKLRKMDVVGMSPFRVSLSEVQSMIYPRKRLNLHSAERVLSELLDRQRGEDGAEVVPLGVRQFLSSFLAYDQFARTASPDKSYAADPFSPSKQYAPTPDKMFRQISANSFRRSTSCDSKAIPPGLKSVLGPSWGSVTPVESDRGTDPAKTEMDPAEFMALLHGDELQNWVKTARYRWKKICKVRGVLLWIAEEPKKVQLSNAILAGGITYGMIFSAWRRLSKQHDMDGLFEAPASPSHSIASPNSPFTPGASRKRKSVLAESLKDHARNKNMLDRRKSFASTSIFVEGGDPSKQMGLGMQGKLVGQDMLSRGVDEVQVLESSRLTEGFYDTRVGSVERLIAWYVVFHSMAKPSSRLPFLNYELGKTESMLRVASTPSPVPNAGDAGEDFDGEYFDEYAGEPQQQRSRNQSALTFDMDTVLNGVADDTTNNVELDRDDEVSDGDYRSSNKVLTHLQEDTQTSLQSFPLSI